MSVYIKGFPLPNNCGACPLRLAWCRERIYMVTRPERCPLVPVPPHGDLIDRKAICLTDFEIVMCDGDYKEGMKMLLEKIESAPTIIPADEPFGKSEQSKAAHVLEHIIIPASEEGE